jgi:hypothetical protein
MTNLTKNGYTPGMERRKTRHALVAKIIAQLQIIQDNEENCMDNMPESLWESDAYVLAEHAASHLRDAIVTLEFAYDGI